MQEAKSRNTTPTNWFFVTVVETERRVYHFEQDVKDESNSNYGCIQPPTHVVSVVKDQHLMSDRRGRSVPDLEGLVF